MRVMKIAAVLLVTACLFAHVGIAGIQGGNAASSNSELISALAKELKITQKQATGGAGAIFGLAKSQLNPADFGKIAASVPGMDGLLKAAPSAKAGSTSALGSLGSMVPGGAGGLASLAGGFQSLGLSPAMVSQFVPVIQKYLESKGGSSVAQLFASALK